MSSFEEPGGPCTPSLIVEINLDVLPILHGALEAVEAGIVSTLQGQNERDHTGAVECRIRREKIGGGSQEGNGDDARLRLLFDPQVRAHRREAVIARCGEGRIFVSPALTP